MNVRRFGWPLAGILFVAIVGYGVFLSLHAGSRPLRDMATRLNHGVTGGFGVEVGSVVRDAPVTGPAPPHVVTVTLSFRNDSGIQQRADPDDFRLRDSGGNDHGLFFSPSGACSKWQRADLYPAAGGGPLRDDNAQRAGATFGPVTLCFNADVGTGRLFLVWGPDTGIISSDLVIPIR